jgi:hypothetical protein
MKQAQSDISGYRAAIIKVGGSRCTRGKVQRDGEHSRACVGDSQVPGSGWGRRAFLDLMAGLWSGLTMPFRLVFKLIAWLGRLAVLLLGLSLLALGVALWAGHFFWIGIPLFVIGLILTLRCLD